MEADYIIVGAGSAGCVLADRLSQDGKSQVLLLEAGSENRSVLVSMPRGMAKIWMNPRYFWKFPIEEQSFRPKDEAWFYGKGLGGSSAVNGTWYYRGQPKDYDAWSAQGNPLWNWNEIQRCYSEFEDYRDAAADPSRGKGGKLEVTVSKDRSSLTAAILKAAQQTGLPVLQDVNTPGTHGAGMTQMTVDRSGRRVSAHTAFTRAARTRPNLTIKPGVLVDRILFEGKRAYGLSCTVDGKPTVYTAKREVIICAGVLQSPKLLQLSGVGPRSLLEQHGIPVIHENDAVGRNMVEHMMVSLSFRLKGTPGHNREFRGWRLWMNTFRYLAVRTGLMASITPAVSLMLSTSGDATWPDVQLGAAPYSMISSPDEKPEAGRGTPEAIPGITVVGFYLRPKSRGSVAIHSGRIEDPPKVNANWLAEAADSESALAMVKAIRHLVSQPALAPFIGTETIPGEGVGSDAEILEALGWMLSTGLHGTGTCRMGPGPDAVVDERLRVHGVSGLRVVDCSVMPTSISGNTNGPAMAVAWRAAELIRGEL